MEVQDIVEEVKGELFSAGEIIGLKVADREGSTCGKIVDLLFEDDSWTVRYLVVETGGFFSHDKVLISPWLLDHPELTQLTTPLPTILTGDQIEASPPLGADAPISRQYEQLLSDYYNYPKYWLGSSQWGIAARPHFINDLQELQKQRDLQIESLLKSHVRSCETLMAYEAFAGEEGESVGTIEDFIFESGTWTIRYLIIKTGSLFSRKYIALSPEWASDISWELEKITFGSLSKAVIDTSPEIDYNKRFSRDFEIKLFDHYDRNYYWHP